MRSLKSTRGRDPAAVTAFPARLNSIVERGRDDIAGSVSLDEASAVQPVRRRFWTPGEVSESNFG